MIHSFVVGADTEKVRADKWISQQLKGTSRSLIQKAFEEGLVKVNGQTVSKSVKIAEGDEVQFQLPEEKTLDFTPVDIPLSILYEDEHLLALDKPAGLIVHPGAGTEEPTLVHALLYHRKGQLSRICGLERQGIVHRLDRGTSGVMVVAKTDEAHEALVEAFAKRTLIKQYLVLVAGVPDRLSGTIQKRIGRNPSHRHKMAVRDEGKSAHTDWELIGQKEGPVSLILCQIHTGRTHQIRVHLADLGFPVLGDEVYGYRANRVDLVCQPERTMLHAYRLTLKHPISGKRLEFTAEPPEDFQIHYPGWSVCLEEMDKDY